MAREGLVTLVLLIRGHISAHRQSSGDDAGPPRMVRLQSLLKLRFNLVSRNNLAGALDQRSRRRLAPTDQCPQGHATAARRDPLKPEERITRPVLRSYDPCFHARFRVCRNKRRNQSHCNIRKESIILYELDDEPLAEPQQLSPADRERAL